VQEGDEQIERPDFNKTVGRKAGTYEKLDIDGVVPPGNLVVGGDILIGKSAPVSKQLQS